MRVGVGVGVRVRGRSGLGSSWTATLRSEACETFFRKTCASLQAGAALETTHATCSSGSEASTVASAGATAPLRPLAPG